jgi:CDP-paratose 2-epimerase
MRYLITGGCGFLGANLAETLLRTGQGQVTVFDNLSRLGSHSNLEWLRQAGPVDFVHGDIRKPDDVETLVRAYRPDVVFHFAGQVAMSTSLTNPRRDFETNALGTFNLLEAVRAHSPEAVVLYSSTNKVYGNLEWIVYAETDTRYVALDWPRGFPETLPLDCRTPYGTSKGAADQYILDYHRSFGLRTTVFRHSSMYGGRQFSTYDQGWIGWFCKCALKQAAGDTEPFTISGSGKQVRDLLHADDMVRLYLAAAQNIERIIGRAFNVGGGMENSLSLIELFDALESMLGTRLAFNRLAPRASDQRVFVADISALAKHLDWSPRVATGEGLARMLAWARAIQGDSGL